MNGFSFSIQAQQGIWCGLTAVGLFFLFLAYRLREDRIFSLLGINILMLCAMVGIDIWILIPGLLGHLYSVAFLEFCNAWFHIFACAYVLATLWFTRALTRMPGSLALRMHGAATGAMALAFLVDGIVPAELLMGVKQDQWFTTWGYDWIFMPYLIGTFAYAIYLTVRGLRGAQAESRRTLRLIVFAYAVLFVGGLLDFLSNFATDFLPDISTTIMGVFAMGAIGTFILTERLVLLYEGQRRSLLQTAEIHGAMEAQRPLGDLGRSAAHISEAIGAYVTTLRSDALSLREDPSSGYRAEVTRIENARRKLETYTTAILDFSKCAWIGPGTGIDPNHLVEECLSVRFPENRGRFIVSGRSEGRVMGNPEKLQRALTELLRNAVEADARTIRIRLLEEASLVCLAIEDDGCGIESGLCAKIAQPFFTTRKALGACGLGASIAEGIIKAHGGVLKFYPKLGIGGGMLANLILPIHSERPGRNPVAPGVAAGWECLLFSDNGAHIGAFLAICGNVGLRPLVLGSRDFREGRKEFEGVLFAILDSESLPSAKAGGKFPRSKRCYLVDSRNRLSPLEGGDPEPRMYCEETILAIMAERRRSDPWV